MKGFHAKPWPHVLPGIDPARLRKSQPSRCALKTATETNEIILVGAVRSGWTGPSRREKVNLLPIPESAYGGRMANTRFFRMGTAFSLEFNPGEVT